MASSLVGNAAAPGALVEPIFDGTIWDLEEGVDFDHGAWRTYACRLKDVARMLGGYGAAAELVRRNKKGEVLEVVYRWHYIPGKGWRGGL